MNTFFLQSIKHFKTIGSLTPSSPVLCDALTTPLPNFSQANVLEVGSGNGVIAKHLINHYSDHINELWVNEINPVLFKECERSLRSLNLNGVTLELNLGAFEDMALPEKHFDIIISSVPLNSLSCAEVNSIFDKFKHVLKDSPSSTFCFYEHIGSRTANKMHSLISTEQSFTKVFTQSFQEWECRSSLVFRNFPPSIVRKLNLPTSN